MKTFFIVLAALFAINCALPINEEEEKQWNFFKLKHNKNYATVEEEKLRQKIFVQNLKEIKEHNEKYDAGLVTYTKGITQFSDMTKQEFISTLTLNYTNIPRPKGNLHVPLRNVKLPEYVDWRQQGAVTPVKAQGGCQSCYTFSATGAMEGQLFKKNGILPNLSEQNIIDCSQPEGNCGCNRGYIAQTFQYVQDNGGIDTEDSYPYEGVDGRCRYNPQNSAGTVTGINYIEPENEADLQDAVANIGPISVGVNAQSFNHYTGGVNNDPGCDPRSLNHAVLVVGYGTENGQDYWIVKNSWGENFGENGYIRMSRNKDNQCGIASIGVYPLV